jgi:hypothetical protein
LGSPPEDDPGAREGAPETPANPPAKTGLAARIDAYLMADEDDEIDVGSGMRPLPQAPPARPEARMPPERPTPRPESLSEATIDLDDLDEVPSPQATLPAPPKLPPRLPPVAPPPIPRSVGAIARIPMVRVPAASAKPGGMARNNPTPPAAVAIPPLAPLPVPPRDGSSPNIQPAVAKERPPSTPPRSPTTPPRPPTEPPAPPPSDDDTGASSDNGEPRARTRPPSNAPPIPDRARRISTPPPRDDYDVDMDTPAPADLEEGSIEVSTATPNIVIDQPLETHLETPTVVDRALAELGDAGGEQRAAQMLKELDATLDPSAAAFLAYELGEHYERRLSDEARAVKAYGRALTLDASLRPNLWAIRRVFYRRGLWPNLVKLIAAEVAYARDDTERADLLLEKARVAAHHANDPDEARNA